MKLVAAALVVSAGACLGILGASRLRQRALELDRMATALGLLATEIGHGLVPLPDALKRVGASIRGQAGIMLMTTASGVGRGEPVAETWNLEVEHLVRGAGLTAADGDILLSLGAVLGRSLSRDQLRHLAIARERLCAARREAEDEVGRVGRLRIYLGLLGALALVLVLW